MKLKPCPFCGDSPETRKPMRSTFEQHTPSEAALIICNGCSARITVSAWKEDAMGKAVEMWNKRDEPQGLPADYTPKGKIRLVRILRKKGSSSPKKEREITPSS